MVTHWKNNACTGLDPSMKFSTPLFTLLQDGNRLHSRIRNSAKQSSRSTPASPSRSRSMVASSNNNNNNNNSNGGGQEQCTCMTSEQYARLRHSDTSGRLRGKRACEGTIFYLCLLLRYMHGLNSGHQVTRILQAC